MKRYKKVISCLISIALVVSLLSSCSIIENVFGNIGEGLISAADFTSSNVKEAQIIGYNNLINKQLPIEDVLEYENPHEKIPPERYYGYSLLNEEEKNIYKKIDTAAKNYWNYISFQGEVAEDSIEDSIEKVFFSYIQDNSDVFWLNSYSNTYIDGKIVGLTLFYAITDKYDSNAESGTIEVTSKIPREDITNLRIKFINATNTILKGISKESSVLAKELYVYQYLVNNVTYNDELIKQIDNNDVLDVLANSAYGAIKYKATVCAGYSMAFGYLMKLLGVNTVQVYGSSENESHQWNMVEIEDSYYHVDVTWSDKSDLDGKMVIDYDYFNLTDEEIARDHLTLNDRIDIVNENGETTTKVVGAVAPKTTNDKYTFTNFFAVDGLKPLNKIAIKNAQDYKLKELYISLPYTFSDEAVENYIDVNFDAIARVYKKFTGKELSGNYIYTSDINLCCLTVE